MRGFLEPLVPDGASPLGNPGPTLDALPPEVGSLARLCLHLDVEHDHRTRWGSDEGEVLRLHRVGDTFTAQQALIKLDWRHAHQITAQLLCERLDGPFGDEPLPGQLHAVLALFEAPYRLPQYDASMSDEQWTRTVETPALGGPIVQRVMAAACVDGYRFLSVRANPSEAGFRLQVFEPGTAATPECGDWVVEAVDRACAALADWVPLEASGG